MKKKEQQKRRTNRDKLKVFNENIQHQFNAGILFWRTAIYAEYGLLESQYKKKRDLETKSLEAAKHALAELQKQQLQLTEKLDGHDPVALARLHQNQEAQALQSERIDHITKSLVSRKRNYDDGVKKLNGERDREATWLKEAGNLMTGQTPIHLNAIPNLNISGTNWEVSSSDQQAGVKWRWNAVLTTGVDAKFDRDAHSTETVTFIQLFGKIRVFAGTQTNLDTGAAQPVIGIQSHPPRPEPNFESPNNPPPATWKFELPGP